MPPPEDRIQARHPQISKSTGTDAPDSNRKRTQHVNGKNNKTTWLILHMQEL